MKWTQLLAEHNKGKMESLSKRECATTTKPSRKSHSVAFKRMMDTIADNQNAL